MVEPLFKIDMIKHNEDYSLRPLTVRKTADEIVNNSVVLQDDDELFFPVKANEVWEFFLCLYGRREATAAQIPKFAFTIPAGSSLDYNTNIGNAMTPIDGTSAIAINFNTVTDKIIKYLYRYVGGANAGKVQLQWAQNVAEAKDHIICANSFIVGHKLN